MNERILLKELLELKQAQIKEMEDINSLLIRSIYLMNEMTKIILKIGEKKE